MVRTVAIALALLGIVGGFAWLGPTLRAETHGTPRYRPMEIEAAKESIALSLLGQLQLSVGDLMWLKSMEYLHVGATQRMPTEAEEAAGNRRHEAQNVAAGLGHMEGVSMVLDPTREWRGFVGDIERSVKPYQEFHKHDDPVELVAWYQLAVKLNPNLERLYTLGAFYLADFAQEPGEARMMLESGLEANPNSFEINGALGRLYVDFAERLGELKVEEDEHPKTAQKVQDEMASMTPKKAYDKAIKLLTYSIELATVNREELAVRREVFDDFQNQVFGESYLYLSKAYLAQSDFDKAISTAQAGYDGVSRYNQRNLLRVQGRIAERAKAGEALDKTELAQVDEARSKGLIQRQAPTGEGGRSSSEEVEETPIPLSVQLGLAIPADLPAAPPTDLERQLLATVREHPYESAQQLAARLNAEQAAVSDALSLLEQRRFVAASPNGYSLQPPGLYVAMNAYDFNFWETMKREIEVLRSQGKDTSALFKKLPPDGQ